MDTNPSAIPPETPSVSKAASVSETAQVSDATPASNDQGLNKQSQIGLVVGVVFILALLIGGLVFLFVAPAETTARVRDIFIIVMALESLLIGLVLVVLIIQIAKLTNLLQHEIKPILDSTNETVSTLRGTTQFLSENLVEPVIKINEYMAALKQFLSLIRVGRK